MLLKYSAIVVVFVSHPLLVPSRVPAVLVKSTRLLGSSFNKTNQGIFTLLDNLKKWASLFDWKLC